MLVALIAMVAVPLVGLGGYGVFRGYQTRRAAEVEASAEIARAVGAAFEAFILDLVRVEHAFGVASADHTYEQIERDLGVVAAEYPAVRDMSWIAPDGKVLASTEHGLTGKSLHAREYIQEIVRGADWRVSPLVPSLVDAAPLFIVARAIRGASGELRAVVAAAVDADLLAGALGRRTRGGWTAIVDGAGTLVAIEPDRHLTWEDRRRPSEHPWIARALSGEEVRGTFRSVLEGRDRIGAVVPIRSIGWAAHASRPVADTLAAARREAVRNGLAALAVALAAIAAAVLVSRRIGGPLRELEQHAAALARGGGDPARIRGPAEVRRVARALDAMAAALSARHAELEVARRGAEAATERAEARGAELDAVVAALPVGLVVTEGEGRTLRVNGAARELLGVGEGEPLRAVEERTRRHRVFGADGRLLGDDDLPATRALRGQRVRGEIVRLEREGGERATWLAVSAAPIFGPDGAARGAVTTLVDVTHVRALQEERETLIHTVSHDLSTPLSVIVNHADLLRRRGGEEARRRAEAILASAGRMQRLVQDLADAARLETGRVQLRVEAIDLARFLATWRERMAGALPMSRVRLSVPDQVPAVVADPVRLDQIVSNLVSNALKYSVEESAVEVELAAAEGALRLSIRDHGQGIAPDDLPRVFERYWRARGTSGAEGLGLGLFITRKLVEAHGWRIDAESELGRGSVFTVVVPLDGARAAPAEGAAA
jgi:signal transduction histidine kinase